MSTKEILEADIKNKEEVNSLIAAPYLSFLIIIILIANVNSFS